MLEYEGEEEEHVEYEEYVVVAGKKPPKEKKDIKPKTNVCMRILYPKVKIPPFKPYYWDIGELAAHRLSHLPAETERIDANLQVS